MAKQVTNADVEEYLLLNPILNSITDEIKELSKKKQDGMLNKFKVKKINSVLTRVLALVKDEPIANFLEVLDIDELPTNSDSVLMLVQFQTALSKFYAKNRTIIQLNY